MANPKLFSKNFPTSAPNLTVVSPRRAEDLRSGAGRSQQTSTQQHHVEAQTLVINEIYKSLQGESTFAGLPCVFVRLTSCNLRCSYCDSAYAFTEGQKMAIADVLDRVLKFDCPLVEITGGEPLLQSAVLPLMSQLCDAGKTVLLETSGERDIRSVDPRVRRIMDLKCPSSGESARNRYENIANLRPTDEVKLVIGTREDYEWAKEQLERWHLPDRCTILFSWVHPLAPAQREPSLQSVPDGQQPISQRELVEMLLADQLPVRFQLQMHKYIWSPDMRGV